jgi:uncharacterized glyoxalase superfamily protein PhnB
MMLGHCPDAPSPHEISDHSYFAYLVVGDVDALHAELIAKGALILHAPENKPSGKREMAVETPDGHRIMIAQPI